MQQQSRKKSTKLGIFSTKNKLIIFFILLVLLASCREEVPRVVLKQPFIDEKICVTYKFERGVWVEDKRLPIQSCDGILGVNFEDYERIRQFVKRCEAALAK